MKRLSFNGTSIGFGGINYLHIKTNYLYTWGQNINNSLGYTSSIEVPTPTKVNDSYNWNDINSGLDFTITINNDGTISGWGGNSNGQLGLGYTSSSVNDITLISNEKYKFVECGDNKTFAIKDDDTLWACGDNNSGVLGISGTTTNITTLEKVNNDNDWLKVSTMWTHVLSIKKDGTLWGWGINLDGELGNNNIDTVNIQPIQQIGTDTDWVDISVGKNFSLALKENGDLYGFGNNVSGQLGLGDSEENEFIYEPTFITNNVKKVKCGYYASYIITNDGDLYSTGLNTLGILGIGQDIFNAYNFTLVNSDIKWKDITSGEFIVSGLKDDGSLWVWGQSSIGTDVGPNSSSSSFQSPYKIDNQNTWLRISSGVIFLSAINKY